MSDLLKSRLAGGMAREPGIIPGIFQDVPAITTVRATMLTKRAADIRSSEFNGYVDQVQSMCAGLDLRKNY